MGRYVENDRFFRGALLFDSNPDEAEFNRAISVYRSWACESFELDVTAGMNGCEFEFGMKGLGEVPGWLDELVRKSSEDERQELFVDYRVEDMERFFGCKVRLEEFMPRMGAGGELELAEKLCRHRLRFGMREEAAPLQREDAVDLEGALDELDSMIGLEPVKAQIHDIASIVRNRGADSLPCMHMVFTGNPGTGKTRVARILGRVLKSIGALDSGSFVETDRSGLVGQYIGHTAQKTKQAIARAKGGVLFIDEAYSLGLYANDLGADPYGQGGRRDFGPEAIDALVKEMEGGDFVCVMAGYPHEMDVMMSCNPGLRDRVGFYVDFPDYMEAELCEIFEHMVRERGFELSPAAMEAGSGWIHNAYENRDGNFGNARLIRRLVDRVLFKQNVRTNESLVDACDVKAAIADADLAELVQLENGAGTWSGNPIGFCVG